MVLLFSKSIPLGGRCLRLAEYGVPATVLGISQSACDQSMETAILPAFVFILVSLIWNWGVCKGFSVAECLAFYWYYCEFEYI